MLYTIALMTSLEALRSYTLQALAVLALLSLAFVVFVGEIILFDRQTLQLLMISGLFRLEAVIITTLTVCTQLAKEEQTGQLHQLLALPLARWQYCLSKCAGFLLLGCAISALLGVLTLPLASPRAAGYWATSLCLELSIVITLSFLMSISLRRPLVATVAVLAFYTLARVLATLNHIADDPIFEQTYFHRFMTGLLWVLDVLLPNLDRFTRAEWLTGTGTHLKALAGLCLMSLTYGGALLAASMIDLTRRHL